MKTSTESARWRRARIAERFANVCLSASSYRLAEDVWFVAIVGSERELRQVKRQAEPFHLFRYLDEQAFATTGN